MSAPDDVLQSLLSGLPGDDRTELLDSIRNAHGEQLEAKRHPRRRRRRNQDGDLVHPDQPSHSEDSVDHC